MYVFKDGSPGVVETLRINGDMERYKMLAREKCQMKQDSKSTGEGDVGGNASFPYLMFPFLFSS